MQRPIPLACLMCLPLLGGCIFPYVGPSLEYTPRVALEAPRDEVRAFRVDIATSQYKPGLWGISSISSESTTERLSEVSISHRDEVPGQVKASVQYGIVAIGPLTFRTREGASVALRLYRPGYELVEIRSWEGTNRVAWKPTADLLEQEKALDRLFAGVSSATGFGCIQDKGSVSAAHHKALLFGASEYERLAKLPSTIVWLPEDLEKRAKAMRDLAAK